MAHHIVCCLMIIINCLIFFVQPYFVGSPNLLIRDRPDEIIGDLQDFQIPIPEGKNRPLSRAKAGGNVGHEFHDLCTSKYQNGI